MGIVTKENFPDCLADAGWEPTERMLEKVMKFCPAELDWENFQLFLQKYRDLEVEELPSARASPRTRSTTTAPSSTSTTRTRVGTSGCGS